MAASTASMCFRSDSLAVYSCINANASSRCGRAGDEPPFSVGGVYKYYHAARGSALRVDRWTGGPVDRWTGRILRMSHHLRSIELRKVPPAAADRFPYTVPVIRTLPVLRVDRAVTFLVGENGSGKSTLLEGIAVAAGLPAVGSMAVDKDETLAAQRSLGKSLKLTWDRRAFRGFFLRAEDLFGFTKALSRERTELLARLDEIDVVFAERSDKAK